MKKTFTILIAAIAAILMMTQPVKVWATDVTFTQVTSASNLGDGDEVLVVATFNNKSIAMLSTVSTTSTKYMTVSEVTINNNNTITLPDNSSITVWTIEKDGSNYAFKSGNKYVYSNSSSSNSANTTTTLSNSCKHTIESVSNGLFQFKNVQNTSKYLKGGNNGDRFAYYASNAGNTQWIKIFKKETGGSTPTITADNVDILYTATGGSIAYTLDAQGTTGTVSASVPNGSWVTLPQITNLSTPIIFTCSANPNALARTETVTLTYTPEDGDPVGTTMIITQAKNPNGNGSENDPFTVEEAIAATPATGESDFIYVSGIVSGIVTPYDATYHNISYNISDDGLTTSTQLQAFRGKGMNNTDFNSNQDILAGDVVTIKGKLTYFNNTTYELAQGNYLVAFNRPGTYYYVAYSANPAAGGTVTMGEYASSPASVIEGGQVAISATANTGYTFSEWSVSGTGSSVADASSATTTFTMGTEDATLTANFTSITTYTVTYHPNGPSASNVQEVYNAGQNVTVANNTFVYADHAFTKWTTNQNGTGTEYLPGATISNIQANIDLYAQWEESNEVTYDFAFTTIGSTGWSNSYTGDYEYTYTDGTKVYFDNSSKQTTTITTIPVTKEGPIRLELSSEITGVEFQLTQWGSKTKTAELWYSTDNGSNYTTTGITSSNFSISSTSLPTGTNAVKITFSESSNQVGVASAKIYKAAYKEITIASVQHGIISTSPSVQANPGQTVTLTATPDAGYSLSAWDVYKTGDASTKVTVENNQFTMPNYAVTVSATFAAAKTLTYSVNGVTSTQNYVQGTNVTLTAPIENIPTGFDFVGWTANPANVGNSDLITSITLNDNATVYAVFGKTISITMTGDDFNNAYSDEDNYTIGGIVFAAEQVASYTSGTFQFKNGEGFLYNKDAFSNLASIVTTQNGTYRAGMTLKAGNNQKPTDGTTITASHESSTMIETYDFTGISSPYIYMENKSGYMVRYSSIVFYFNDPTAARYTRVFQNENIEAALAITGPSIIPSGKYLNMGSYTLTNNNADNFIIEDGGELIVHNAVQATVKKNIEEATYWGTATSYDADAWYFIASPVNTTSYATALTTGTEEDYDLYMLDWATKNWLNKKDDANSIAFGDGFTRGTGYLYASKAGNTLSVGGQIQPLSNNDDATVTLANDGWNLIGNPLTCKVTVDHDFGMLNNGSTIDYTGTTVNPFQGIVVWGSLGETVTFTKAATQNAAAPSNTAALQMTLAKNVTSRGTASTKVVDNAVVNFNSESSLPKFTMLEGCAKLYFPMEDADYAIVSSDCHGTMPVNFKAKEMGRYTISVETEGIDMSYLHLIDRLTGEDVNLLLDNEYSFIASNNDSEERFILSFTEKGYDAHGNEIFVYQSGNDLIVNGEGELQIFDVMGRMVKNTVINGVEAITMPQGVYIFRLNENIQKIVVR